MSTKKTFPAHFPYEDGWKFCEVGQRFHKTKSEMCPHHPKVMLRELHGRKGHVMKMRRVWNNGLGLPLWARMKEYVNTPEGEEAVNAFCDVQETLIGKIKYAVPNRKITYGELGAKKFRNHWFIKETISEVRR